MRGNPKLRVAEVPYHREKSPARLEKASSAGNVPIEKVLESPKKSWKRSESPCLRSSESPRQHPYYYYYCYYYY